LNDTNEKIDVYLVSYPWFVNSKLEKAIIVRAGISLSEIPI